MRLAFWAPSRARFVRGGDGEIRTDKNVVVLEPLSAPFVELTSVSAVGTYTL